MPDLKLWSILLQQETHTKRCAHTQRHTGQGLSLPGTTMFMTMGYFWSYPDPPVLLSPLVPSQPLFLIPLVICIHLLSFTVYPASDTACSEPPVLLGKLRRSFSSLTFLCSISPLPISSRHGRLCACQSAAQ